MPGPTEPPAPSEYDAIRSLLAAYCQTCDDGQFEEFALLFVENASFVVMGGTQVGRDAIRAFMEAALPPEVRGKHIISEPLIQLLPVVGGGLTATAQTDYLFVGKLPGGGLGVTSSGRYLDHLDRGADGRWRFGRREIVFLVDPA
jgi:uncharacterized protein (TIGR02246 family)